MKYVVMLGDGMADRPIAELSGRTPLEAAKKPAMDYLSRHGELGLVHTLYEGMPTGSDIANLSVLGFDPKKYYTGRSPIEALGLSIPLSATDVVFRLNLVSISLDEPFGEKTMLDHSSDKITNAEAYELLDAISAEFKTDKINFYRGVSYRHIMVWSDIEYDYVMMPPHDILGQKIGKYLPDGVVLSMMKKSYELLMAHPVNKKRIAAGLKPANCIWLWGEGTKPCLEAFRLNGSVITAVPLIHGLANGLGLKYVSVPDATGDYYTNYTGKAQAAIEALKGGDEFVFIHVEAPDECGHDGDTQLKVKAIERIDEDILSPVKRYLDSVGEEYSILLMPDHATPIEKRTHTIEPVPYVIYRSDEKTQSGLDYSEKAAASVGIEIELGHTLMDRFIR